MKYKNFFIYMMLGMFLLSFTSAFNWTDKISSYYNLDETSGTISIDSLNIKNGTITNALINQIGRINKSYIFDGSGDLVTYTSGWGLTGNPNMSFSIWVKPNVNLTGGSTQTIIRPNTGNVATRAYTIVNQGNKLRIAFYDNQYTESNITCFTPNSWTHIVVTKSAGALASTTEIYCNGIKMGKNTNGGTGIANFTASNSYIGGADLGDFNGTLDEFGVWNRTLNSTEVMELYNSGEGLAFNTTISAVILINKISPLNATVLSTIGTNFTIDLNITGSNPSNLTWKNATIYVWNSNGSLFNNTTITLTGNSTNINQYIDSFLVGDYYWNILAWYGNATFNNYTTTDNNLTFIVGATTNSESHNADTFETSLESFTIGVSLLEGSELSLAKLVYNGTEYIVTNINITGTGSNTTALLSKSINIPLNVNQFSNQTNSFYWKFTYNGGQVQILPTYTQVSQPTVLIQCNGTYSTKTLNFTFYDELNQTNLKASAYPVNLLLNFKYWLGDGGVKKNYSFQTLGNNTTNSFQFCLYPNSTLYMDMDMQYYSAVSYSERTYYYRNESLTNTTKNVLLYSLLSSEATKFSVNLKEGTEIFSGAIVGVWKYFVGLNSYKLVMVGLTDDKGKFSANLDLDQTYNFSIIRDGVSYGSFIKQGTCTATPCDIDINIITEIINPNDVVNQYFAQNVIYNISENETTQILTLNFQDITGTAQYWRLLVTKSYLNNDTKVIICDAKSYSSIGSLTCNYTGYEGDLDAKIYISRSPEKLVVIYNWLNTLDYKTFGDSAILASVIIIIILFFVGIRNPVNALVLIPFALVALKFIQFLPFSWGWITGISIMDLWLISKLKT